MTDIVPFEVHITSFNWSFEVASQIGYLSRREHTMCMVVPWHGIRSMEKVWFCRFPFIVSWNLGCIGEHH